MRPVIGEDLTKKFTFLQKTVAVNGDSNGDKHLAGSEPAETPPPTLL